MSTPLIAKKICTPNPPIPWNRLVLNGPSDIVEEWSSITSRMAIARHPSRVGR